MTKADELIKRDLQEATYIGEDGGMVVDNRFTRAGAYRKMIARLREDCGEEEVKEFMENCKADDLGMAYFHVVTDKDRSTGEFDSDTEWYVSGHDHSYNLVWVYWGG